MFLLFEFLGWMESYIWWILMCLKYVELKVWMVFDKKWYLMIEVRI